MVTTCSLLLGPGARGRHRYHRDLLCLDCRGRRILRRRSRLGSRCGVNFSGGGLDGLSGGGRLRRREMGSQRPRGLRFRRERHGAPDHGDAHRGTALRLQAAMPPHEPPNILPKTRAPFYVRGHT